MAIGTKGGAARRWGAALFATLIVALAPSLLAAQQIIGRAMGPSVSIDYGVLDALGPAPTLPSLLLGRMSRPLAAPSRAAGPRFPVLSGRNAVLPRDRVVLIPPGEKRTLAKPAERKRRVARRTPPRRMATTPPRRGTAKAPRRPKLSPPRNIARTRAPSSPTPPRAPPVPLMPVPALPPVASLPLPPPPAMASLPPLPAAPPVGAPPPAPISKPVVKPKPKPKAAPRRVVKPKPKPAPKARARRAPRTPVKTASLPRKAAASAAPRSVQVLFEPGSAKLNKAATDAMKRLADGMKSDEALRIQLLAYAGGASGSASQARRLSLSRALAVRSYLIGQGVRSTRIDVRALGNKTSAGPPDRVDLMAVRR